MATGPKLHKPPKAPALTEQEARNLKFLGVALGATFLAFVVTGFVMTAAAPTLNGFLIALLVGPVVGVGLARLRYGWPRIVRKDGRALVSEKAKPWLFFPIFLVVAAVAYVVLGVFLTPVLPVQILAYVAIAAASLFAGVVAYALVGFPHVTRFAAERWRRIPAENRPWLFFPIAAAFAVVLWFLLGLGITQTAIPLDVQPLIVLPVALALACVAAYFLVGFPKPQKRVRDYVPEVTGRHRPPAFLVTVLLAGLPLAYLVGLLMNYAPAMPDAAVLPLALLVGYAAAFGVAAAVWGTPRTWRRFADYKPGLPAGARAALFLPIVVGTAALGAIVAHFAGLDLLPGILVGLALGVLLALQLTGARRALRERAAQGMPEIPDKVKPLVFVPTWILVGGLVFVVLAYALPAYGSWHVVVSVVLGLATALAVVEGATLREWRAERRAARARAAEFREKRRQALASGKK